MASSCALRPERATSRRAVAEVVREGSDNAWRFRVFVGAATGDRSRSGTRDVPARSEGGSSRWIGSTLAPACLHARCDRGPVALRRAATLPGLKRLPIIVQLPPWTNRPGDICQGRLLTQNCASLLQVNGAGLHRRIARTPCGAFQDGTNAVTCLIAMRPVS